MKAMDEKHLREKYGIPTSLGWGVSTPDSMQIQNKSRQNIFSR
jgi:hypothetical protein